MKLSVIKTKHWIKVKTKHWFSQNCRIFCRHSENRRKNNRILRSFISIRIKLIFQINRSAQLAEQNKEEAWLVLLASRCYWQCEEIVEERLLKNNQWNMGHQWAEWVCSAHRSAVVTSHNIRWSFWCSSCVAKCLTVLHALHCKLSRFHRLPLALA